MRSRTASLATLAFLALALALALVYRVTQPRRVIAFVGGEPIGVADWRARMREERGREVLQDMIRRQLVRRTAQQLGVSVTKEDLERKRSLQAGGVGSEADLRRRLEEAGVSYEEYVRDLEDEVLFDKVLYAEATVNRAMVADFYRRHQDDYRRPPQMRARLMVFDSKQNAEAVRSVLDEPNADFAGLAKAFSTDPGTKDEGGDTGWFGNKDYAPEIVAAAERLELGQTSAVFQGPDGWCILKLSGRRPGGIAPLDEVYAQVESRVRKLKAEGLRERWLWLHWPHGEITVHDSRLGPLPLAPETTDAPPLLPSW